VCDIIGAGKAYGASRRFSVQNTCAPQCSCVGQRQAIRRKSSRCAFAPVWTVGGYGGVAADAERRRSGLGGRDGRAGEGEVAASVLRACVRACVFGRACLCVRVCAWFVLGACVCLRMKTCACTWSGGARGGRVWMGRRARACHRRVLVRVFAGRVGGRRLVRKVRQRGVPAKPATNPPAATRHAAQSAGGAAHTIPPRCSPPHCRNEIACEATLSTLLRVLPSSLTLSVWLRPTQSRRRCCTVSQLSPGADVAGVSPVPVQMWQGEPSNWQPSPAVQNGMGWDGVGVGWGRGGVGWGGVDALSTRCADVAEKCGEVARLEQRRQVARKRKRVAARQRRRLDQRVEVHERQLWLVFEAAACAHAHV
jgi:hypothetical protein